MPGQVDGAIALSVIVASIEGAPIERSIDALVGQIGGRAVEVLIVSNPGDRSAEEAARRHPDVRLLVRSSAGLVPQLWGHGIAQSRGRIIAITIAGCVPDPGWIDALLDAHEGADAAVGGPIVQAEGAPLSDRALAFARYGAYLPPVSASATAEVPGDNGSYKRSAIEAGLASIAADGFWEAEVNAMLRATGQTLRMLPRMRMTHTHSFGAGAFCRQRWQHGRLFGAGRARRLPLPARAVRAALAPVTLAVMTARAAGHARRAGMLSQFIPVLPVVVLFYACWVAGESAGLLAGSK